MTETKAHIKDRMLKTASAAWGYPDKIGEAAFDPLVAILMEVVAAELEKISHEISMSRDRVLQQMVQLMVPDVLTAPLPAVGVLHARSIEDLLLLNDREQFYVPRQYTAGGKSDIWFSPAGNYYITDAGIRYIATGNKLFRYTSPVTREIGWPLVKPLPAGEFWVGIEGSPASLRNAQVYFELKRETGRSLFFHHLPDSRWSLDGHPLAIKSGYNSPPSPEQAPADWLQSSNSISRAVIRLMKDLYRTNFITILDEKPDGDPDRNNAPGVGLPLELHNALPETIAGSLSAEKITWLRIRFPENIHPETLEDLHCQINCFPVINRQLHEITYRLQDWINIIPLVTEQDQPFFDIHEVTDLEGNSLHQANGQLQILLRKGGAGRFDDRDARALTEHLLQLLRDETAAFALYGRDFITSEIRQIQQVINRVSGQLADKNTTGDPAAYLEVTGSFAHENDHRHLIAQYWSTQGRQANFIKAATPLIAYKNGGLRQGFILLMTPTQGGRNRLQPHESIPAYKSAVLSKDRIMSPEDIRLFCARETGALPGAIEVKKGVMIGPDKNAGYIKTIDVHIHLDRAAYTALEEGGSLDHWQLRLQVQLAERSMAFMPFRVFFSASSLKENNIKEAIL